MKRERRKSLSRLSFLNQVYINTHDSRHSLNRISLEIYSREQTRLWSEVMENKSALETMEKPRYRSVVERIYFVLIKRNAAIPVPVRKVGSGFYPTSVKPLI